METREIENIFIPLSDGCKLAAKIWLPEKKSELPVPAILEYLPYRKRDGTAIRDQLTHPYFAAHGYACVRVDIRGSGESDGLLLDEYTKQEQDDCIEVLNWIEKQTWCNGKIGMMGISWGGFNSLQVAARNPSNLHAIISLCSTDNRYTDDIHYMGGCLLNDNFQWSAVMSAMMSRSPDKSLLGENWKSIWKNRLTHQKLLATTWLEHQTYDAYWKHGSISENWQAIQCPVYVVGGWADGYTNAIPRMLQSLNCPRKGLIGPWGHKYPHFGKPGPQIGFLKEALRWWDKWLKEIETGIMAEPMYRVWMQNSIIPAPYYERRPGRWVAENKWPSKNIREKKLFLTNGNKLTTYPSMKRSMIYGVSTQSIGETAGAWYGYGMSPEKPTDQRIDDARSICFDSAPLKNPLEILGSPILNLKVTVDKPEAFIAVRLNEVFPDGSSSRISYGLLNFTHRKNHEEITPIKPNEKMYVSIPLKNIAHSFSPGNRIHIAASTTYWPLVWPSASAVKLGIATGKSNLSIPVRPPRKEDKSLTAFTEADSALPLNVTYFRPAGGERFIERDLGSNSVTYNVIEDAGDMMINNINLRTDYIQKEKYSICDNEPLSAKINIATIISISRDEWKTRTEMQSEMTSDETYYYLKAKLDACENDKLTLSKTWEEKIPRKSYSKLFPVLKPISNNQERKSSKADTCTPPHKII